MKQLKFKNYDSGFVRAYFKHDKTLYCVQPGMYLVPDLLFCSRDGEPSHPVKDGMNYTLTNMPPYGDDWNWEDVLEYYNGVASNGQLMRRINDMFGHDKMNKAKTIYDKYFYRNKSENRLGQVESMAGMDCKDYYMEKNNKVYEFHDGSTLVFSRLVCFEPLIRGGGSILYC